MSSEVIHADWWSTCCLFRAEDGEKEKVIAPAPPIKQATVSVSNLATTQAEVRL